MLIKLWLFIWQQNQILDLLNRVCVFTIRIEDNCHHFNCKLKEFMKFVLLFLMTTTAIALLGSVILPFLGSDKAVFVKIAFPIDYETSEVAFWSATIFIFVGVLLTMITLFFSIIIWYLLLVCSLRYDVLGSDLKNMGRLNKQTAVKMTGKQLGIEFPKDLRTLIKAQLILSECVNFLYRYAKKLNVNFVSQVNK